MSKIYKIEYIDGITRISFSDRPSYKEITESIDDIAENYPYEKRLWDLTNSHFDFTLEEIKSVCIYGKTKFIKSNKVAVIAPDDLAYGEMREFMVYREGMNTHACVFRTEEEAVIWLNK